MQSASFYNTESQQSLYLKEILTQLPRKKWEGFDRKIRVWQKQRGYLNFGNAWRYYKQKSIIPDNLLRLKWLREIKEEKLNNVIK